MRKSLKNWKEKLPLLPNPKSRPNDFQRLVLSVLNRGMTIRDAERVFGVTQPAINRWQEKYGSIVTEPDRDYFINRALELGADNQKITEWFDVDETDVLNLYFIGSLMKLREYSENTNGSFTLEFDLTVNVGSFESANELLKHIDNNTAFKLVK